MISPYSQASHSRLPFCLVQLSGPFSGTVSCMAGLIRWKGQAMSEPKFTPGPWHRNIPPASRYPVIFAGKSTHVAAVKSSGHDDTIIEANAHLIAAAPSLYKALHDLLNDLSALMSGSEGVAGLHLNGDLAPWTELEPGGQFEHLGAIDSAFAALAKARGEA